MPLNVQPLKEPRGFIRLLQVIFAILAFSTTTSYNNTAEVEIRCKKTPAVGQETVVKHSSKYEVAYPFSVKPDLHFAIHSVTDPCTPALVPGVVVPVAGSQVCLSVLRI